MRCGVRCLDDVVSRVSGGTLQGGYIVMIQPHGRHGRYNPHLHIIATRGGWEPQAQQWIHLDYVPYKPRHDLRYPSVHFSRSYPVRTNSNSTNCCVEKALCACRRRV